MKKKPSLSNQLKSLGVKVGMDGIRPCPELGTRTPIESVVKGNYRQTRYGESFVAEKHLGVFQTL